MKCKSYTCPLNKLACPLNKLGRMTGAFTWPSCTTFATNVNWTCHYKSTRATIATRTGCVRRGIGHKTRKIHHPTYSSWTPRAHWKQDLVIEQLAYKNEAFIIVLQETYCTTAEKLVIPNFSVAGSILSRNHGLATFVHERLEWSLVDQSLEQSERLSGCA